MRTGLGKVLETSLDSFFTLSGKVNLEFGIRFIAKNLLKTTRRKIGVLVYDGLSSIIRVNPGRSHSFVQKLDHDVGMDALDLEANESIADN